MLMKIFAAFFCSAAGVSVMEEPTNVGPQCYQHANPDGAVSLLQRDVTMTQGQVQQQQQRLTRNGAQEANAHKLNPRQLLKHGAISNTTSLLEVVKNLASAHVSGELDADPITEEVL